MKPVIGVVADVHTGGRHSVHSVQQKYLDAVTGGAGAIALVLPGLIDRPGAAWTDPADLADTLALLDGIFLTGATSNVAPARYGATLDDPNSPSDPARDHVTLALIEGAVARGLPVLGVCRGMQLLQHRCAVPLRPVDGHVAARQIIRINGEPTEVNSYHRFAAYESRPPLDVWATAADGVVKAVSHSARPTIGIMWHPERNTPFAAADVALFRRVFGTA